jgi:hypothetical protein
MHEYSCKLHFSQGTTQTACPTVGTTLVGATLRAVPDRAYRTCAPERLQGDGGAARFANRLVARPARVVGVASGVVLQREGGAHQLASRVAVGPAGVVGVVAGVVP